MAGPQNLSVDFMRTLLQEAAAVPLRAVHAMQQEFIQAQSAMAQQSVPVQQRALSQQEESLRVQHSLIAPLARSAAPILIPFSLPLGTICNGRYERPRAHGHTHVRTNR